jgi:DNA replication and repair protein RecF
MTDLPARVRLRALRLTEFRNYGALSLAIDPTSVVLTGDNGAGKTNLLEAISFLSPGRGLRRAAYDEVARAGAADGFAVHAEIDGPLGLCSIGTGTIGAGPGDAARRVRVNGAPARSADVLLEWLRVVWLTPSMDGLFTGPAADRRRFLDRLTLAIDPAHGERALAYEKAMRGRNRLLADGSRDDGWMSAIEAQMAETGSAIAAARSELVGLLQSMMERLPADGAFPRAGLQIAGALEAELAEGSATDVEERFRSALAAGRERDRVAGRTLDGPHRTDLVVRHETKAMPAELSSTGEQKALLIGIVLAHARLVADMAGQVPLVLLDEVAAHLDARRREALFAILDQTGAQAFMTGTDASLFAALEGRAQFLTVAGGSVEPTDPGRS